MTASGNLEKDDLGYLHPIKLINVKVKQLVFVANQTFSQNVKINANHVQIAIREDAIDPDSDHFNVAVRAAYGIPGIDADSNPSTPFSLLVELEGTFFNQNKLPLDTLYAFRNSGAQLTLMPYLRENVYGLSLRGGAKPVIIPLYQVPFVPPGNAANNASHIGTDNDKDGAEQPIT